MKKVISIVIPTYNEEKNIPLIYNRLKKIFESNLLAYSYEIIYIDNCSNDNSRNTIKDLCLQDKNVKAIFNATNFGFIRSTYYGLMQSGGDCSILLFADMQDPPELIVDFIERWESGNKIVLGIKNKSKESKLMYFIRSFYYRILKNISEVKQIEHFTGFGLYDKSFIAVLRSLNDPYPYLRGLVAEYGANIALIHYEQQKREHGKSSFNFIKLYDVAMLGITSYSKVLLRMSTFTGMLLGILSLITAFVTFILKISGVVNYPVGTAALIFGVFFLSAVQLFFIGILGEYIANISIKIVNKPLVVEEKRINF